MPLGGFASTSTEVAKVFPPQTLTSYLVIKEETSEKVRHYMYHMCRDELRSYLGATIVQRREGSGFTGKLKTKSFRWPLKSISTFVTVMSTVPALHVSILYCNRTKQSVDLGSSVSQSEPSSSMHWKRASTMQSTKGSGVGDIVGSYVGSGVGLGVGLGDGLGVGLHKKLW